MFHRWDLQVLGREFKSNPCYYIFLVESYPFFRKKLDICGVFSMKIIGVVGQNGSDKDEILKYLLARYDIPFLSTGDIVREMAREQGLEPTRENLKVISEQCFHDMGKGCFVKLVVERIRRRGSGLSGISGIRSVDDVMILREMLGSDFALVSVSVSNSRQRYERMVNRGEERDPQSYDQFLKQDQAEEGVVPYTGRRTTGRLPHKQRRNFIRYAYSH
jgi:dephospho-CoA kinase